MNGQSAACFGVALAIAGTIGFGHPDDRLAAPDHIPVDPFAYVSGGTAVASSAGTATAPLAPYRLTF